jgi:hypothetical protein
MSMMSVMPVTMSVMHVAMSVMPVAMSVMSVAMSVSVPGERWNWEQQGSRYRANERKFANH